ncbi:MAG: hypothetical protein J6S67_00365 [Methanobrevibacter sp.]|nr:hypothetical protein [Methanobrevibacter sp.]
MTVRFYNAFSKRKNSTKKPANTDAHYDVNVVLKEDTTIERPSIVLTNPAASASGNPVTVSSVAGNMVNPVVTLNVIQEGSGTPSPSNPRNIGAYGDARIHVNSDTTIIDFGGTVYGGTLDVTTGVLTVKYKIIEIGDYNWTYNTSYQFFITNVGSIKNNAADGWCDIYENTDFNTIIDPLSDYAFCVKSFDNYIRIKDSRYTDAIQFKNDLSSVKICIELATYQTIQLTPTQIALAQGTNVVSTNGNSTISFGYLADELATDYVYAYIPKWDKYYFVATPNIITNNHIQYDLEEDYLASRKTEVGSTVAHIAYSSTGWDKDLTDARMAVKGTKTIYHDSKALPFLSGGAGCYIVGVVDNKSTGKRGALSYYRMDAAALASLIKYMCKEDFCDQLIRYFTGKPMDFIQSCIWVPVDGSDFVGNLETTMYLGDTAVADYSTSPATPIAISHYPVSTSTVSLGIVSLSLGSKWDDFRDNQPYSSASLFLPGVGLTDLNINDFYESVNVNVETILDITTGDCTYKIYDDTNQLLKTISFNAAASVSLSQINTNASGMLAGIGGAVGGVVGLGVAAVTMNPLAGVGAGVGILGGASAAIMAANQRSTSIKGTNGGRSDFYTNMASTVVVRQDTEDCDNASYIARWGRPVGKTHAISNHSGYVQCEAASVALAGDNTEREIINNYLNTGFFYE